MPWAVCPQHRAVPGLHARDEPPSKQAAVLVPQVWAFQEGLNETCSQARSVALAGAHRIVLMSLSLNSYKALADISPHNAPLCWKAEQRAHGITRSCSSCHAADAGTYNASKL